MPFDRQKSQATLENILDRIRAVNYSIQNEILIYRDRDTLVDEDDEYKTMRDIRLHLLEDYRKLDRILTELDRYK
jgi:hypothetical protein